MATENLPAARVVVEAAEMAQAVQLQAVQLQGVPMAWEARARPEAAGVQFQSVIRRPSFALASAIRFLAIGIVSTSRMKRASLKRRLRPSSAKLRPFEVLRLRVAASRA